MTTTVSCIAADAWLSEVLGRPIYRVDVTADTSAELTADACLEHQRQNAGASYFVKVPATRPDWCRALGRAGFYPVDVNVTLTRTSSGPAAGTDRVAVVTAAEAHHAAAIDIAASSFRCSRFHLDPAFTKQEADAIKREWVRSYAEGRRGDRLLVAIADGHVAGFLAVLVTKVDGEVAAVIDLIGVAASRQKQGIGRALVKAFVGLYSPTAASLRVGTQVANLPSLRLYESCGFTIQHAAYVLHAHC